MTRSSLSPIARLLDRDVPERYLVESTDIVGAKVKEIEVQTASTIVFRVRTEWLSLPTSALQEVTKLGKIHKLPHTRSRTLMGLVNVRGELFLCAALDFLLGLDMTTSDGPGGRSLPDRRLLVCDFRGERLAFPVCEVVGIRTFSLKEVRSVPATLSKSGTCMSGVVRWDHRTIGCLNPELVFESVNEVFG